MKSVTITAIAAPWGEGGLGIVRMSGPDAVKIANKIFITRKEKPLKRIESHKITPGFIIDPKKPDQYANACRKLLENDPLRIEMGRHAASSIRKRFSQQYSIKAVGNTWENVLSKL